MATLRTIETENKYISYKNKGLLSEECSICSKSAVCAFVYWKIIENSFPYDRVATKHHMLTPLRHIKFVDLTVQELEELTEIKTVYMNSSGYDCILESTSKTQSIPAHYHLHLMVLKEFTE